MSERILDAIRTPRDLHVLTEDELVILAQEIRDQIIETTSKNGGHVGSSLGAVEIILALHSLMDCPQDRIVFDVGHQAYAHKLVTGRLQAFDTLRQFGGISGFTKPGESPYDLHYSGHASDSISVALGLAKARDLCGRSERVVAVIGDAALSGGMAFEALNEIGQDQTPMVIVLNDNRMSISPNVGALVNHLGALRVSKSYRGARDGIQEALEQAGPLARRMLDFGRNAKDSLKQFVLPDTMLFEELGIICTTPVDGHDISALRAVLKNAFAAQAPVLVHVVTQKGHGFKPAEEAPEKFHGLGPYDAQTGQTLNSGGRPAYTKVFSDALIKEAKADDRIVAITAAMPGGTGLEAFGKHFPDRMIDVGIAEGHANGMACGLAQGGLKPVLAIYSTFEQRGFDQMIIDDCLPNLDITFCLDRAGLVGDDGPTHHGIFDIAYMRMVPNMKMLAPSDEAELVLALHTALKTPGPVALRYPRGAGTGAEIPENLETLELGVSRQLREGSDVALLAFGRMVESASMAAELLEEQGISSRVVDMRWVKPFDEAALERALKETKLVVTLEEGVVEAGVGQALSAWSAKRGFTTPVVNKGIPDCFVEQGKIPELFKLLRLDGASLAEDIQAHYQGLLSE